MPVLTSALMGFFLLSGAIASLGPAAAVSAPKPTQPAYNVSITGYNAVPGQTDDNPLITANGGPTHSATVAARSQDLAEELPFGTIIEVVAPATTNPTCGYKTVAPLIGYRVITDTMNVRYHDRVDILYDTKDNFKLADGRTLNASQIMGSCNGLTIRVVGHIDLTKPAALPKTQDELRIIVGAQNTVAIR